MIRAQKFYKTLPHKITAAEEEYKKTQPEPDPELDWEFEEVGDFDGDSFDVGRWTISYRYKPMERDQ